MAAELSLWCTLILYRIELVTDAKPSVSTPASTLATRGPSIEAIRTSFHATSQVDDLPAAEAHRARLQLSLTAAFARAHGRLQAAAQLQANLRSCTAIAIAAEHAAALSWEHAGAAEERACEAEERLSTVLLDLNTLEQSIQDKDAKLATLSAELDRAQAELIDAQQQQAQLAAEALAATQQARQAVDNTRRQRSREANAQRVLKAKSCNRSGLRDDYCNVADELQQAKRQRARLERCAANLMIDAEQWAVRAQQVRQQVVEQGLSIVYLTPEDLTKQGSSSQQEGPRVPGNLYAS
ncbi:hypothetical protein N2152v2_004012 [Parachlorella kessleri]